MMDHQLRERILNFQIGTGEEAMSFYSRLAIENGWSQAFAKRAFEEYKKFLYLCGACGDGCAPSDAVDQVWHLHLSYTRSYWRELCPQVLRKNR